LPAVLALLAALAAAPSEPQIDLYTMGQGEVLFQRFGHAALCVVYDSEPARSRCYNYGTTDFGSPPGRLGWQFVRGTSRFWVSVWPLRRMIHEYREADRTLYRQRLPLAPAQVRELARVLAHDALPENRYYVYHHFKDNCTTRVRDHIDAVTGGALSRDSDGSIGVSFRELGRRGLAELTGLVVIAHFFLGRDADLEVTEWEAMFLPDYLRASVAERLGAEPEVVYTRAGRSFPTEGSSGKLWVLLIGVIVWAPLVATRLARRGERAGLWATSILLALIALPIWFVAIASNVAELRWNEAVLVFWPTDILFAALSGERRRRYATVRVLSLLVVSAALATGIFRQPIFVALLIPLVPAVLVEIRSGTRST